MFFLKKNFFSFSLSGVCGSSSTRPVGTLERDLKQILFRIKRNTPTIFSEVKLPLPLCSPPMWTPSPRRPAAEAHARGATARGTSQGLPLHLNMGDTEAGC